MSNGKTVLTSKESNKLDAVRVADLHYIDFEEKQNMYVWKFDNVDDAYRATVRFANAGFEYVQRIV